MFRQGLLSLLFTLVASEWDIPGVPTTTIHLCDTLLDTISCTTNHFLWTDHAFLGYSPNYTIDGGIASCPNTPESCLGPANEVDRCTSYRSCATISVPENDVVICDNTGAEEDVNFLTLNYACINEADHDFTDMCSDVNTTLRDVMLVLPNWPLGAPDDPLSCTCYLTPEGGNQDFTIEILIFFLDLLELEYSAEELVLVDDEGTEIFDVHSKYYLHNVQASTRWTSSGLTLRFRKGQTTVTGDWKTKVWLGLAGTETFRLICEEELIEPVPSEPPEECGDGNELELGSMTCQPCARGFYRTAIESFECLMCPSDWVTAAEGAIVEDDCTVPNCTTDTIINAAGDGCEACPEGSSQPMWWQTECDEVPWYEKWFTEMVAGACVVVVIIIIIVLIIVCCIKPRLKRTRSRMPRDPLPILPMNDPIYNVIAENAAPEVKGDIYLNPSIKDQHPLPDAKNQYLKPYTTSHPQTPNTDPSPTPSMETLPQVSAPGTPRAQHNEYDTTGPRDGGYLRVDDVRRTSDNIRNGYVIAMAPR